MNLKLLVGLVLGAGAVLGVSSMFVKPVPTVEPSVVVGTPEAPRVNSPTNSTVTPSTATPLTQFAFSSKGKSITPLNLNPDQVVLLNDAIYENSARIAEEIKEKAKKGKELYLLINSPGGSVLDGAMIISAMEASKVHVNTVCLGLCASMAFVIFEYGHTSMAVDRSFLMAHPAAGGLEGTVDQMQSRLDSIQSFIGKMNVHIATRAGLTLEQFRQLYLPEMWLDAEDARTKHFSDELVSVNILETKGDLKTLTASKKLRNDVEYIITKNKINVVW